MHKYNTKVVGARNTCYGTSDTVHLVVPHKCQAFHKWQQFFIQISRIPKYIARKTRHVAKQSTSETIVPATTSSVSHVASSYRHRLCASVNNDTFSKQHERGDTSRMTALQSFVTLYYQHS